MLIKPDGRRRRRHRDDHLLVMATEGGAYSLEPNRMAATSYLTEGASFVKTSPFLHESAALLADGAAFFKERRQRWTRREEADFYRVVSTFGVVYDVQTQCFDWSQFRAFARLDKKTDESLEKYYYAFVAMCKRVCRMQVKDSELADPTLIIDPITEERASRTLYRIELLRQIREQVLPHPKLEERLRLCQPSPDLPAWWEAGKHDRDLLYGAAKHGVSRTDYHIQNDPELGFLQAQRRFIQSRGPDTALTSNPLTTGDLIKDQPKDQLKYDSMGKADIEETKEEKAEAASPKQEVKTEEEEKTQDREQKENDNEAEVKSEESHSIPQSTDEEKVTQSEDTLTLPVSVGKDTITGEPENPTGPEENLNTEEEEEEEGEKMDEDKSEKSSQAEAEASSERKNFDEESNASMSTARDETRDYFGMDDGEPSVSQTFGERATFSFWPKDRVMINRMDSICEAIIKGKWPSNRRQLFDLPGLLPGYNAMATDSPIPRRSMGDFSMMNQSSYSGSDDITLSPQVNKEEALSLSVPRQRRRRRRKVEIEAERAAKRRNLMDMI
ncbi:chromodomain-helicase-DNA-binding protein 7-like [Tachysurus fulvidraco]|uniref:chromodomain-helicase-DNA-binding protein 7-like n=1 Tax=Tachysurus fulvidraco TaxID=1234273 RepID=UPI001FEE35CC|nr:chromodomain-helicase-DNA-binding protein 7-like [Tachysurus fulvidraco]